MDPFDGAPAWVRCRGLKGEVTYFEKDLRAQALVLERAGQSISGLTDAALRLKGGA